MWVPGFVGGLIAEWWGWVKARLMRRGVSRGPIRVTRPVGHITGCPQGVWPDLNVVAGSPAGRGG
jgi:hypothetical protein